MQIMEIDRIIEMGNFIQVYTNSIQTLGETMNQVEIVCRQDNKMIDDIIHVFV
jgi:hypothetical protein